MTFTVFISSTSELIEYRQAARDICIELGLLPVLMEQFPAMDFGATKGSQLQLNSSDVYVGIVAFRYGHVEDGYERSVTAEEYRYAGERGIERLCFLMDPTFPWPRTRMDSDPQRIDSFRTEIDRKIRRHFTTVDDFRSRLATTLVAWAERALDRRTAAACMLDDDKSVHFKRNESIRLRLLCGELQLHLLLECYRGAKGDWVPLDDLVDAARIVKRLEDETTDPHDVPAILKFATWVAYRADTEDQRRRALAWVNLAAIRRGIEIDVVADLRAAVGEIARRQSIEDRLVVRLEQDFGQAMPRRYWLTAMVHRKGGAMHPLVGDDDRSYLVSEVRAIVMRLIGPWARICDPNLVIEFLVPRHLLGEPFDQWPCEELSGGEVTPLGVLFGVLVRDLDRSDDAPSALWLRRWKYLHASERSGNAEMLRWIPPSVAKLVVFRAMLSRGGDWVCLAFERFAGDEASYRLLVAGLDMGAPAILWVRSAEDADSRAMADLRRQLSATPLPLLPVKLLDLRREAVEHEKDADHIGRSLALLWDDPDRSRPATELLLAPVTESD